MKSTPSACEEVALMVNEEVSLKVPACRRREGVIDDARRAGGQRRALTVLRRVELRGRRLAAEYVDRAEVRRAVVADHGGQGRARRTDGHAAEVVTQRGGRDRVDSGSRQTDREILAIALVRRLADGECGGVVEDARSRWREGVVDGARPAGRQRRALAILRRVELRGRRRTAEDVDRTEGVPARVGQRDRRRPTGVANDDLAEVDAGDVDRHVGVDGLGRRHADTQGQDAADEGGESTRPSRRCAKHSCESSASPKRRAIKRRHRPSRRAPRIVGVAVG